MDGVLTLLAGYRLNEREGLFVEESFDLGIGHRYVNIVGAYQFDTFTQSRNVSNTHSLFSYPLRPSKPIQALGFPRRIG